MNQVKHKSTKQGKNATNHSEGKKLFTIPKGQCGRCGKTGEHKGIDCPHRNEICGFCKIRGHLDSICIKKRMSRQASKVIAKKPIKHVRDEINSFIPPIMSQLQLNDHLFNFEIDTGTGDSFCTEIVWEALGKPELESPKFAYEGAGGAPINVLGTFKIHAKPSKDNVPSAVIELSVAENFQNLLGRQAMFQLNIDVNSVLRNAASDEIHKISHPENLSKLKSECEKLCEEFSDIFNDELGCLKDFELEVEFKENAEPKFYKPRIVPFAIQNDLSLAYERGIERGIWSLTHFNEYGTPVVPIRKPNSQLRVCGDYSVGVNSILKDHRQVIPVPDELLRKLGGGFGYSKVDLRDAFNQIKLGPISQRKLALSTHKGVLLQQRLPYGIKSAPGYFQQIMENVTQGLKGIVIYIDDILVSGVDARSHLANLRALFQRLSECGLRCNFEKCHFAQAEVQYLGHRLTSDGIAMGDKVHAVLTMPPPSNVTSLK